MQNWRNTPGGKWWRAITPTQRFLIIAVAVVVVATLFGLMYEKGMGPVLPLNTPNG